MAVMADQCVGIIGWSSGPLPHPGLTSRCAEAEKQVRGTTLEAESEGTTNAYCTLCCNPFTSCPSIQRH